MFGFLKAKPRTSSDFADFIRDASSARKKKVYREVIEGASARQNAVLRGARGGLPRKITG